MAEALAPPSCEEEPSCSADIDALRRRLDDVLEMQRGLLRSSDNANPDLHKQMQDFFVDLQSRVAQIDAEEPHLSALKSEDLEMYAECLKEELCTIEKQGRVLSDEIMDLRTTMIEDSSRLECYLSGLDESLRQSNIQGSIELQDAVSVGCLSIVDSASMDYHFKRMEIDNLIEKACASVATLEHLQHDLQRNEALGEIEDKFSDIDVMDFEGNCIRLSLRTSVKSLGGSLQKYNSAIEPSTFVHELLIEVADGTMEMKNLKVFPTDVPLDDIIDCAKSSRCSLQKVISLVQHKIRLCILRHLLVKVANDSRFSVAYMDRDETITAHLMGGIDAYIKLSQGWPMSTSALQLISIKSSSDKSISLNSLCRIKELANSLDREIRHDLCCFIDNIEEILVRETRQRDEP